MGDIYYDVDESPRARAFFEELQSLLGRRAHGRSKGVLRLLRPISSRFLQLATVCDRLSDLWDTLIVYYFSFLQPSERIKFEHFIAPILSDIPSDSKARFEVIQGYQTRQNRSASNPLYFWFKTQILMISKFFVLQVSDMMYRNY